jgi:Tfp pilus assembly protein PilN
MATTLMPLDPASTPQRAQRLLPIAANLLPAEITDARRARHVRARVVIILGLVTILVGGWYAFALVQRSFAQRDLDAAYAEKAVLEAKQSGFADVVNTQRDSKAISDRLKVLLQDDLRWATLLNTLRDSTSGTSVTVTGVSGALTSATGAATTGSTAPNEGQLPAASAAKTVGTLTVTGTAPDKDAVAAYVDALGKLDMFSNTFITSVTAVQDGVQFSFQGNITAKALGGRWTTTTGGK